MRQSSPPDHVQRSVPEIRTSPQEDVGKTSRLQTPVTEQSSAGCGEHFQGNLLRSEEDCELYFARPPRCKVGSNSGSESRSLAHVRLDKVPTSTASQTSSDVVQNDSLFHTDTSCSNRLAGKSLNWSQCENENIRNLAREFYDILNTSMAIHTCTIGYNFCEHPNGAGMAFSVQDTLLRGAQVRGQLTQRKRCTALASRLSSVLLALDIQVAKMEIQSTWGFDSSRPFKSVVSDRDALRYLEAKTEENLGNTWKVAQRIRKLLDVVGCGLVLALPDQLNFMSVLLEESSAVPLIICPRFDRSMSSRRDVSWDASVQALDWLKRNWPALNDSCSKLDRIAKSLVRKGLESIGHDAQMMDSLMHELDGKLNACTDTHLGNPCFTGERSRTSIIDASPTTEAFITTSLEDDAIRATHPPVQQHSQLQNSWPADFSNWDFTASDFAIAQQPADFPYLFPSNDHVFWIDPQDTLVQR